PIRSPRRARVSVDLAIYSGRLRDRIDVLPERGRRLLYSRSVGKEVFNQEPTRWSRRTFIVDGIRRLTQFLEILGTPRCDIPLVILRDLQITSWIGDYLEPIKEGNQMVPQVPYGTRPISKSKKLITQVLELVLCHRRGIRFFPDQLDEVSHRRAATRRGRRRVLGLAMREECLQSESHAPIIAGAALFSLIALDSPAFVVLLGPLLSLALLMGSRSPVGPSWIIRVS